MANLTNRDKNILESYLQMEEGHLLSFSQRSLSVFFEDYNIDITDESYTRGQKSGSKANKMRGFWTISDNQTVGRVILGLIQRYGDDRESNNHYSGESGYSEQARLKCIDIANKLISENTTDSSKVKSLIDYFPTQASTLEEQPKPVLNAQKLTATSQLSTPNRAQKLAEQTRQTLHTQQIIEQSKQQATQRAQLTQKATLEVQHLQNQEKEWMQLAINTHSNNESNQMNNQQTPVQQQAKQKVFIVHGHDENLKMKVQIFISKIGLEPIILMDQASAGDTIIEKLENHGEADYAIVLYTGCDVGKGKDENDLNERARQNVVFEHGYFIARLGRKKVAAIVAPDVEKPNDTSGIVYIGVNDGWEIRLAKELEKAKLKFDAKAVYA